jgi:amidase
VPVGVKDIIDVAQMPTRCNSPIYQDNVAKTDAACIALIKDAGGIILGKTVTTELANRHPGPTKNPHDSSRTPGGSSSGSAAAVADHQVPVALGTQTSGSVIRPSAYCGVVGYKPSFGVVSRAGVKELSGSLDTVGLCARTIGDVALMRAVLAGVPYEPISRIDTKLRVGVCFPPGIERAEQYARRVVELAAESITASGMNVSELVLPDKIFGDWLLHHGRIVGFETTRSLTFEKTNHRRDLSQEILEGHIKDGELCTYDDYVESQRKSDEMRGWIESEFSNFDVILTLSTAGEAPLGLAYTGDATFNSLWTLLHTPALTLPFGRGPSGMPIGVQLVGRRFNDEKLLMTASAIEEILTQT